MLLLLLLLRLPFLDYLCLCHHHEVDAAPCCSLLEEMQSLGEERGGGQGSRRGW